MTPQSQNAICLKPFDDGQWSSDPERCLFLLTDENVILYLSPGVPGVGSIGTDGIVRGNVTVPSSATVPYAFIVKF